MSGRLATPGVLADHWPWGPPRAIVVVPRRFGLLCDMTYVIYRSYDEDLAGRSYQEENPPGTTWQALSRAELPGLSPFCDMPADVLDQMLREVDLALAAPPRMS